MKKGYSKLILVGVFVLLPLLVVAVTQSSPTLQVANQTLQIEIAKTEQQKETGLCCRTSLDENAGMLFVYDKPGIYHFWMKDTKIPLDMYWIDAQKTIIYIEHSVQPESYPKSFGPENPAQYILETNAGYAKRHNITIGETVIF